MVQEERSSSVKFCNVGIILSLGPDNVCTPQLECSIKGVLASRGLPVQIQYLVVGVEAAAFGEGLAAGRIHL